MFGIGTKELIVIAIIFIVLFGSKKIPELAQSLVDAVKTLRKAVTSDEAVAKKK